MYFQSYILNLQIIYFHYKLFIFTCAHITLINILISYYVLALSLKQMYIYIYIYDIYYIKVSRSINLKYLKKIDAVCKCSP